MVKKQLGGPRCPGCGNPPYDITVWEKPDKGPAVKKFRWFCPSVVCNPMAKTMDDVEVWQ